MTSNGLVNMQPCAHSDGSERMHPLADHLRSVGTLAGSFAEGFRGSAWATLAVVLAR